MGAECCQDVHDNSLIIVSLAPAKVQYQISLWPQNDQYIQNQLKLLNKQNSTPLKHFQKSIYYLGEWMEGVPQGQGLLYNPSYLLYKGKFEKGVAEGHGQVKLISLQCSYQGMFQGGHATGQGIFRNQKDKYTFKGHWSKSKPTKGVVRFDNDNTIIEIQDYQERQAVIRYKDGKVYIGRVHQQTFLPHGVGNVELPDKSVYFGEWQNGIMHGKGCFEWRTNDEPYKVIQKYDGQYINGKKHGYGKFIFESGKIYEGFWANGKMEGKGKIIQHGVQIKSGIWANGVYKGKEQNHTFDFPLAQTSKKQQQQNRQHNQSHKKQQH